MYRKQSAHRPDFVFDESLLGITETDLEPNEIGLNDLSYEQLKTK